MNSYSELFEYAGQLVRNHIDDEIKLATSDPDSIFGESAWLSNFFEFNVGLLNSSIVRDQVEPMLSTVETEQRPYNAALARITSLYINLAIGCGKDHMDKMVGNCVKAINSLDNTTKTTNEDPVMDTFKKYPVLIVSALGNQYFISQKITYLKQTKLSKAMNSTLVRGSQK